jgi:DNA-binding helix-hairpin-helix protein with protein kinase domain
VLGAVALLEEVLARRQPDGGADARQAAPPGLAARAADARVADRARAQAGMETCANAAPLPRLSPGV